MKSFLFYYYRHRKEITHLGFIISQIFSFDMIEFSDMIVFNFDILYITILALHFNWWYETWDMKGICLKHLCSYHRFFFRKNFFAFFVAFILMKLSSRLSGKFLHHMSRVFFFFLLSGGNRRNILRMLIDHIEAPILWLRWTKTIDNFTLHSPHQVFMWHTFLSVLYSIYLSNSVSV